MDGEGTFTDSKGGKKKGIFEKGKKIRWIDGDSSFSLNGSAQLVMSPVDFKKEEPRNIKEGR